LSLNVCTEVLSEQKRVRLLMQVFQGADIVTERVYRGAE